MKRSFQKFVKRLEAISLGSEVEKIALDAHVSLRELYDGRDRAPSIVTARRKVYRALLKGGKGLNEVARLFDRAPNGVLKLTRKPQAKGKKP
jgi:hypothetical protein